ncbi:MAG: Rha family transcriptional regulator [Desulfovibrio sp.]
MDKGIINANVTLVNGVPMVSSLDVAEKFEKPHADVLKAIRKLLADLPKEFNEGNFSLVEYVDDKGEKRPMYNLTRDAFSLLAMGFTGKKALAWKVKYIEAFNAMEAELLKTAKKRVEHKKARQPGLLPTAFALNLSEPEPGDRYHAYLERVEAWRKAAVAERDRLINEGLSLIDADRVGRIFFHVCADFISEWLDHTVLSKISVFDKFLTRHRAPVILIKCLNQSFESVNAYLK